MRKWVLSSLVLSAVLLLSTMLSCVGPNVNTRTSKQELVYVSWVSLLYADFNRDGSIAGKVGHHFVARIEFSIGWIDLKKTGGYASILKEDIIKWAVTNPEYILFGDLPPGLKFNPATGWIEGTPTAPGRWLVTPGVRCKKLGNNVYNGNGYWYTYYWKYGYEENAHTEKIWIVKQSPITINIQP